MPKNFFLKLSMGVLLALIVFSPIANVNAQDGNPNNWLSSPTFPLDTCGAYWGVDNPAGGQKFHNAIDFCGGSRGGPVLAIADGVVVYTDWWPKDKEVSNTGHGEIVALWHSRNKVYTYYSHLQEQTVTVGQEVKKGDTIGLEGSTGAGSGPHVHFVVATKDPATMVTVGTCGNNANELEITKGKVACFPNPDDFLGKDVVAQDLGIVSYSPTGEKFEPADGTPIYTGGQPDLAILPIEYYSRDPGNPANQTPALVFEVDDAGTVADPGTEFSFESDSVKEKIKLPPALKKVSNVNWLIIAAVFSLCFIISERFRRGTLIAIVIAIPILILIYLL